MPAPPAMRRQHQALGEQLADEVDAGGAECEPDGDFPPACGRPREQQVRHVRAGHEEHESDDGHQEDEERDDWDR